MKDVMLIVTSNEKLVENVYKMTLQGDLSDIKAPGQFVNIKIDGLFLRRPISVCDINEDNLTIIYKVVGKGTEQMSKMKPCEKLQTLTGLGNGYDLNIAGNTPLLIGGGVGVPPVYYLGKKLIKKGITPSVILGFNKKEEVFYEREFRNLGCNVALTTVDGSTGIKGFVTDALREIPDYTHIYCCGPEPMLKAVYKESKTGASFSFEERMGCGFGACMGCSCKTITGYKRICKDGPVMEKEEILWED